LGTVALKSSGVQRGDDAKTNGRLAFWGAAWYNSRGQHAKIDRM